MTVVWDAMTVKASRLSKEKGDIMKADLCNGSQLLLLDKGDHYSAIVIPDTAGRKERRKVVKRMARIQDSDYEVEPKKLCSRESDVESMVSSTKSCLVWNNYCALAVFSPLVALHSKQGAKKSSQTIYKTVLRIPEGVQYSRT